MAERRVWRLITHHSDPEGALKWCLLKKHVALGWNSVGNLTQYPSPEEITVSVRKRYPNSRNAPFSGRQLWNFFRVMQKGDLVILSTGKRREAVFEVTGDYVYSDEEHENDKLYRHLRAAKVLDVSAERVWQAAGGAAIAEGNNIRWALVRCGLSVDLECLGR